jgi:hypothetical protein
MRIASTITWLMLIHGALATQRVVVTFETREIAAMPHKILNATIVRQYGRRIVLNLGRTAVLPEAWIGEMLGVHVTVELDSMVGVSTPTWNLADSEPHSIQVEKTVGAHEEHTGRVHRRAGLGGGRGRQRIVCASGSRIRLYIGQKLFARRRRTGS